MVQIRIFLRNHNFSILKILNIGYEHEQGLTLYIYFVKMLMVSV